MLSDVLAEDFDEEIGASVGDGGLGAEVWCGGDEDPDLDDLGDFVQSTDRVLECGQRVEGALTGALDCGVLVNLGGDDAGGDDGAFADGDLA